MSSKKQLRRGRKGANAQRRRGINPATAFVVLTVAAVLVLVVLAGILGGDRTPPRAGAVWSAEHGHWH